jgi:hypothetical protein
MQAFFRSRRAIAFFLCRLPLLHCPFCGLFEVLVRHGYSRWYHSPLKSGIRAWRVRCKKSPRRNGCGRTFSLRLGGTIPRRCFTARQLWSFLRALGESPSIKQAWERAGIPLSLDTGCRLYRTLCRCQSVLRTNLCARAPPPKEKAGAPLLQVIAHLQKAFGHGCPVQAYQEHFQKSILAMA